MYTLSETDVEMFANTVKRATENLRVEHFPELVPVKPEPVDPLVARVHGFLNENPEAFGCKREEVIGLLSALTGMQIVDPVREQSDAFDLEDYPLAAVVPLKKNQHGYKLNEPVVLFYCGMALDDQGETHNHLPGNPSFIRPATDEEIDVFFASLGKIDIDQIYREDYDAARVIRALLRVLAVH